MDKSLKKQHIFNIFSNIYIIMKRTIKLTESQLISLIDKIIKEQNENGQMTYSKDQLKSMGIEIQKELKNLLQTIKNKTVNIDGSDYYILNLGLRDIDILSKKDPSIVGEIEITYSEKPQGSKLRQQIILGHFKNTDKPMMVSNEFTSLFSDSLTGTGGYESTELQNYLNGVLIKVLGNK